MNRRGFITVATLVLAVVACQERALAPTAARLPAVALTSPTSCPAHADFYVSDETSLMAAIDSARPGDTIALKGVVDLTIPPNDTLPGVFVQKDSLTFTCATPGSGMRAEPAVDSWLFVLLARHLTVEHLSLDATNSTSGAILAFNGPEDPYFGAAGDIRVIGNQLQCGGAELEPCLALRTDTSGLVGALVTDNTFTTDGSQNTVALFGVQSALITRNTLSGGLGTLTHFAFSLRRSPGAHIMENTVDCLDACLFANASPGVTIARNHFRSSGQETGIHLQNGVDGDSVIGNTVVALTPSLDNDLGGIRLVGGANVVVSDNAVSGPWANSFALTDLTGADVERNTAIGAVAFGIAMSTDASMPISVVSSVFRSNQVSSAGLAGIDAAFACSNAITGNDLQGNAGNMGLHFEPTTGANTYVGNPTVVVDNGAFDCNGDGVNDPNHTSGTPRRGTVSAGARARTAAPMRSGGRLLR